MRICQLVKDGGPESVVWGYTLIEIKWLFSIILLHFKNGSRDAYHNHAFHAFSWVLKGALREEHMDKPANYIWPSFKPFITTRQCFHKVTSLGSTWALTFRGPWSKTWNEYHPPTDRSLTLTHGRKEVQS